MMNSQVVWQEWITKIQSGGYAHLCATLMDAFSPIALLSAQILYVGQPVLSTLTPAHHLTGLIELLEDRQAYKSFTCKLREKEI